MDNTSTVVLKRRIKILSISITVSGFLLCILLGLVAANIIPYTGEVPLMNMQGIVTDSVGNIYVHTGMYGKVSVYSSNGNFIRSWSAISNGIVVMEITDSDTIIIHGKDNQVVQYNLSGKVLLDYIGNDDYLLQDHLQYGRYTNGNIKYTYTGFFNPEIKELSPVAKTIITQKWYFSILNFFIGFILAISGGGIRFYLLKRLPN
jgi:hypothetical protein